MVTGSDGRNKYASLVTDHAPWWAALRAACHVSPFTKKKDERFNRLHVTMFTKMSHGLILAQEVV